MLPLIKKGNRPPYRRSDRATALSATAVTYRLAWMVFATIFTALCLFMASPVSASSLDLSKINEIPQYGDELPTDEFMANSRSYRVKTQGDKHLEFSIRVPNDWNRSYSDLTDSQGGQVQEDVRSTNIVNTRLLGKIARFLGPARMDHISYLDVEVLDLEYSLSMKNWILNYVINKGVTLQGMREVGPNRYEILYNAVEGGVPYVVRMIFGASGAKVILASYYLPEKYWTEERAQQERVINSIEFLNPKERKIENVATYQFLDLLRFNYPVSWKLLAPNIYSTDDMEARIINTPDGKALDGEIKLTLLSTSLDISFADEVGYLREGLHKMGLDIGDLKNMDDVDLDIVHYDHVFWNKIEVYDTKRINGDTVSDDYEFWLGIFVEDRYYYLITMLSPTRNRDFLNWARNYEAYKVVVSSIRP